MQDEQYQRAQKRVRKLREFYSALLTYVWVNFLLLVINLATNPQHLWFFWVALIWGIILAYKAFTLFTFKDRFLGEEWEKKKIEELLSKKDKTSKK